MEKWYIKKNNCDVLDLAERCKIPEYLAKILSNRGIINEKDIKNFLKPNLNALHSPDLLKDCDKSADIVIDAINNNKKIRIVGDYDVDGVMSTYIFIKGFEMLGLKVDYEIPDRMEDGYGINARIIEKAYHDKVDLVITCDNGVSAYDAIEKAKELGLKIIVTDHHELPKIEVDGVMKENLIKADAVIDPKREDCPYPYKEICGATVAFKLIQYIFMKLGKQNEDVLPLLEYAAIATICDVVELIDENRAIVRYGLNLLNDTRNIGLKSLIETTGLKDKEISAYHIGFILGPTINASGRLKKAETAVNLLLANETEEAMQLAATLKEYNNQRRRETENGIKSCKAIIQEGDIFNDKVLVVYNKDIHESVAGIIAGRLKSQYSKPTIILTKAVHGVKGSGRSIEGYNMVENISKAAHILEKYGGHAMAAGLSLEEEKISELRQILNRECSLSEGDLENKIYIDLAYSINKIDLDMINKLDEMMPFGTGNPRALFGDKSVVVRRATILGKNRNVVKFNINNRLGSNSEAIYFGNGDEFKNVIIAEYGEEVADKLFSTNDNNMEMDIIYYPQINSYLGNVSVQIVITNFRFLKITK